jgi:branched-chain amino acid transport system ATP-binding protein
VLTLRNAEARYGDLVALRGVSLDVGDGEFVALVGANAQGKSTLLKSIAGVMRLAAGSVSFEGEDLTGLSTDARVRRGIVLVPEGRHIFPYMSVEENLILGGWAKHLRAARRDRLDEIYALMPRLRERRVQLGGSLSGGEQQMLAVGRALMSRPRLLMLDEPSLGLSPLWVESIYSIIREVAIGGTAILLVEQNVPLALRLATRGYVVANGLCVKEGLAAALLRDEQVRRAYMGL